MLGPNIGCSDDTVTPSSSARANAARSARSSSRSLMGDLRREIGQQLAQLLFAAGVVRARRAERDAHGARGLLDRELAVEHEVHDLALARDLPAMDPAP